MVSALRMHSAARRQQGEEEGDAGGGHHTVQGEALSELFHDALLLGPESAG